MKQQKCFLYAYCAGVIDSDGSIFISKYKLKSGHENHQLQIKVSQTRSKVVKLFQGLWGGNLSERISLNGSGKPVKIYSWCSHGNKALEILKKIYPFLRGKKDQAEVAIMFQEKKERMKKNHTGRWNIVPQNEIDWRDEQYNLLKSLKKYNN